MEATTYVASTLNWVSGKNRGKTNGWVIIVTLQLTKPADRDLIYESHSLHADTSTEDIHGFARKGIEERRQSTLGEGYPTDGARVDSTSQRHGERRVKAMREGDILCSRDTSRECNVRNADPDKKRQIWDDWGD